MTMNVKRLIFSTMFFFAVGFGASAVFANDRPAGDVAAAGSAVTVDDLPRVDVATASPTKATVDAPHDPIAAPIESIGDIKAARKYGWAAAAFLILWQLSLVASKLGQSIKWLAVLGKGRVAVVVGAVGALGIAGYNAMALGGSLVAALFAALTAAALFINSDAQAAPKAAAS